MRRGGPIRSSTRTAARRAEAMEVLADAAAEVRRRSRGRCEVEAPPCTGVAADTPHHRKMRSAGGGHTAANLFDVCPPCHTYIHANPAESYDRGWLIRRHA